MALNRHWLPLLVPAFLASLAIQSASAGDIDPVPPYKYCKPVAIVPPATGCTTTCRPTIICAQGSRPGTLKDGSCVPTNNPNECTLTPGLTAQQPLFSCKMVDCQIDATTPGKKCEWTYAGGHPTNTVTFTDCSGTPGP